jgi:hypothetical protein
VVSDFVLACYFLLAGGLLVALLGVYGFFREWYHRETAWNRFYLIFYLEALAHTLMLSAVWGVNVSSRDFIIYGYSGLVLHYWCLI